MPPTKATNHDVYYNCVVSGGCTEANWQHAIAEGTMWKYVKDYNIYRCPMGDKNQYVTYTMSMSMNTYPNSGTSDPTGHPTPTITNINQIAQPAGRFVFLDTGFSRQGAFFVRYYGGNPARWYDLPPMRHEQGTTFVFADGHTEYRKWTDPHALAAARIGIWGWGPDDNCDCDLRWMVKRTWGKVLFECSDPNKNCEF
jgi:prepilin-type processing-associated H-X9-DG protein